MNFPYPTEWPQFFTATIYEWNHLLKADENKNIIVNSLQYMTDRKMITLQALVIMSNHVHFIWQPCFGFKTSNIQSSFTKYTSSRLLKNLKANSLDELEKYRVNKYDRMFQIWKREPLSIELFSPDVFYQKLNYIHENPLSAGLCKSAEDYFFSSARFYFSGIDEISMLTCR